MAVVPIFPVLLLAVVTRCKCDYSNGFNGNSASQFGAILKPPPPPQLMPLPFHRGTERNQRLNTNNAGYQYPPPSPQQSSVDFKFPAPFYKQYNFNFVPPPQPFSTTPSPSTFQKITGWLFPSQQTSYADTTIFNNNVDSIKKDCNPCNLVPWLPVIRYNTGTKSVKQNSLPTYGPPSPTAYADALKAVQKYPQPFNYQQNQYTTPSQLNPAVPHVNYGPPAQNFNSDANKLIGSTYGPPSVTHTVDILTPSPLSSTYSQPSSSYEVPTSTFVLPTNSMNSQFISTSSQDLSNDVNKFRISTQGPPHLSYGTPFNTPSPLISTHETVSHGYDAGTFNKLLPSSPGNVEVFDNITPTNELQVPKTASPIIFKNSYGDPITNTKLLDISYPISASAAETKKVNTQVLPTENVKSPTSNVSFMVSNPAPFSLNRGRNIHTLQPIALPNLSVSLLPPIFNARPFRPAVGQFSTNILQDINQMLPNNINIQQSVPLTEYTHSVEYPATIIQSPIIEVDPPSISNKTKAYRGIASSYVVDEIRDISSQASEDHISATKTISDASIEITGTDVGNELYYNGIPVEMKPQPSNHKTNFADLRGIDDEDVDKYRSENNLQNIDSPLLYLKPSAPHKSYGNFVLAISSPIPNNDYEIYDDLPTTVAPQTHTLTTSWDETRTKYDQDLNSLPVQKHKYKPKIVQIIVPYTTNNNEQENNEEFIQTKNDWTSTTRNEYQARKVPSNDDDTHLSTVTESYSTESSTKEEVSLPATESNTEHYAERYNFREDSKDDANNPPFDIIKLQHAIDDWTVQEYSKSYFNSQRTHNNENYAKQIPDDYFTTTVPTDYGTASSDSQYEFFDHEGSSSVQYMVTDNVKNKTNSRNKYNSINRHTKSSFNDKQEVVNEVDRLHIYTASSSFRKTTTTTPAPWGQLQTSISPLTKEKIYVVTSKPWKEAYNVSKDDIKQFESKKVLADREPSPSTSDLRFKSPRFISRPSFDFTSGGKIESDSDSYSKKWYEDINALDDKKHSTSLPHSSQSKETIDYKNTNGTAGDSLR